MMNYVHLITYTEYVKRLLIATKNSKLVYLNCDVPEDTQGTQYFTSREGISYLKADGFMGGLCRFKEGKENLTKIHQQHRISLGGFFLDCYEGKLSEMYKAQDFHTVCRVPFKESYAKEGWEEYLSHKPNVLLMSLDDKSEKIAIDYEYAYEYASSRTNYKVIQSVPLKDKAILDTHTLSRALKSIGKDERDIISITDGFRCKDYYIEKPKTIIRLTSLVILEEDKPIDPLLEHAINVQNILIEWLQEEYTKEEATEQIKEARVTQKDGITTISYADSYVVEKVKIKDGKVIKKLN
jgi:hypothetical protein